MDEFRLINHYFKKDAIARPEVLFGIGDDCACLNIPAGEDLLVSVDTLVSGVHFLPDWDPYDIAYKAVMVNVSDCVAMAACSFSVLLALTLPCVDESWLTRFAAGLKNALGRYHLALIGGDTTRGPLSVTLTIHALAPNGRAVRRQGASEGDGIYVTGHLGLAAYAVAYLAQAQLEGWQEREEMKKALHYPTPRVDWIALLREYASAAIDISDGLLQDLNHLCQASSLGAALTLERIPIHPALLKLCQKKLAPRARSELDFATQGGDDYEICFTVPKKREKTFLAAAEKAGLACYLIGVMQKTEGLFALNQHQQYVQLSPKGYLHFRNDKDEAIQ